MSAKRKTTTKRTPAWTETVNPNAFASLDGARGVEEVMIHVYWSALGDIAGISIMTEASQHEEPRHEKPTA